MVRPVDGGAAGPAVGPVGAKAPGLAMAAAVRKMADPVFAVVDGAAFEDIEGALRDAGLRGRALFIETGREHAAAGPWLVPVETEAARDGATALAAERHACVFWSCDAGEAVLFHHLRRLNQVSVPAWAAEGKAGPDDPAEERGETVLFRHWDPRVLDLLMPLLDPGQFSAVLGPAEAVAFGRVDSGGAIRPRLAVRSDDLPPAPPGMLRLHPEQIEALDAAMQSRTRRTLADYLRQACPDQTRAMTDGEVHGAAASSMAEAAGMGVAGEHGMALWAYMRLTSRTDLGQEPLVRRFLADPQQGRTPAERMERLFALRGRALQGGG